LHPASSKTSGAVDRFRADLRMMRKPKKKLEWHEAAYKTGPSPDPPGGILWKFESDREQTLV